MGNFDFVRHAMQPLHDDCARAESYLASDPRSACFYSRRAVEELVDYLYDVLSLPTPYRDDLAAKISDTSFKAQVPQGITQKLTMIRRVGNTAVHDNRPIRPDVASAVLRELFHVIVWASYHHSPHPAVVPLQAQFKPALAAKAAPLSRQDVARLAEKFAEQDAENKRHLTERDERLAAHEAEIAALRSEIAAAQDAIGPDTRDYDEASSRDLFIDLLLREAGWALDQTRDREYEVSGMPNKQGRGFVDYVLWGEDGLPLAVVEAKRTSSSPEVGQQQAKLYADCLEAQFGRRPVIFYSNGYEHRIWDDAGGYPPRETEGFYTRDELELLVQRRQTKLKLTNAPVNTDISGRPYQVRAIKAVGSAFDRRQREALLVMATGSGKTRTTIALVDLLQKANWVKRVLFLADRTALVRQSANAFKEHLPGSTTVNLVTERAIEGRVYVSTYPTMMNLINKIDGGARRFGSGYFDLIVIDEAHRSVYAKYGAIFEYFDSLLVGLTATPKDEVDHNTYRLFHLEDGVPTDNYTLDEAVEANYLVPPKGISVGTQFLRAGIRYDDLTESEKDQWDSLDWGDDGPPVEIGSEELNRFLFNEDTVDKVLETLMVQGYKVASGDRLGKTIIFAKSQKHAEFIEKRFNFAYPEYQGHFARVITHQNPYAQSLIDDFSIKDKAPHIAISVDMLDTGIDVPEIVNLVFFKVVRSKSKFWQMIGRGTRLSPDLYGPKDDKKDFLVFDFCGNLEYFSQDLPGSEGQIQKSLSQRLFETRLGLITALGTDEPDLRASTARTLLEVVDGMNLDNFVVRPHRRLVEKYAASDAWQAIKPEETEDLLVLAGLPSTIRDADEEAKRFDLLILRRQLAQLEGDAIASERVRETVQNIAVALLSKTAIPSVAEQAVLLEELAGDEWWIDVTLPMLELARLRIRGLVRFIEKTQRNPIYTDFEDTLGETVEIALPGTTPGTNFERFRSKAESYLREHLEDLALQRLRRNKQLTESDLDQLEQMLIDSGGQEMDITWATEQGGGLGLFVRNLVGLDRSAAIEAFENYLDGTRFSAEQVRFVNLIVDELTKNGVMEPGRLFESPYTDHAPTGPGSFFSDEDLEVIVGTLRHIKRTAEPERAA
ncbi:restriction endonuclease subunit R [Rhodococcus sp. Leaf7]|uniref:DEAD/DEAH box helicase family protein n=1 Tax=unclassified Rhodococcus (in: high G+C Gram-positive bacteria) TaxID=192944 RepID=UPI0007020F66|nr:MULTISPECIES: DEAD/DEAH box helicase family protein [unclassified Rhodococcus (in: high G+C Gram-positive bacteria)]KQU03879.1 restriction endonuclease subunit R [Rhodococcus sp. Leaf7]KQU40063.1 restriction endonuclease subunit R [Rhodococcus sp. Leaf247]